MHEGTGSGERSGSRYQEKRQAAKTGNGGYSDPIQVVSLETGHRTREDGRPEKKIGKLSDSHRKSAGRSGSFGSKKNDSEEFLRLINSSRKSKEDETLGSRELTWQERLQQRRIRQVHRILWGCAGVFAVIYAAAAVYFSAHFYEGSTIYGIDCSQMTAAEAKEEVAERLGESVLTIQEREGRQETIRADQIDLRFVDDNSIDQKLKAQRSYLWPVMFLLDKSGSRIAFTYDKEKAKTVLGQLECFNDILAVRPRDAYIEGTSEGFEIVPEEIGTTLDKEKASEAVFAALDQGKETVSFEEEGCYLNPSVYRDDEQLNQDVMAMNDLVQARVTYEFGDRTEVLDASVMQDWIVKLSDGTFAVDDSKAELYVEALARKYDTFGMERQFTTSYGTVVSLYGGDYGWAIDQAATLRQLLNAIQGKEDVTLEPEYLYTAMSRNENDIGDTYVEICISQQRMICYKDGNVVSDTPVVTGNPNKGHATPSGGVWSIDAKMRDYVLKGEDYQTPVDYWMPFNGDVGIHDLQARAYFGGSIYLTNGSHGCVNTPYDQVQIIYNAVEIGTPVIVYDSP